MAWLKGFWNDGFSIDETQKSILVIMFVIFSIVSIVLYFINGDVSDNITSVLQSFIYVIGGVNGVSKVAEIVGNKTNNEVKF